MNAPNTQTKRPVRNVSRYGYQLQEKQQLKEIFGIREQQLRKYYTQALKSPQATGDMLIALLEQRLDNAVFRAGFAPTRPTARQLVNHGFFQVNGRKVDIPSYSVTKDDVITVKETKRSKAPFGNFPKSLQNVVTPNWIVLNPEQYTFTITGSPSAQEANLGIDVQAIVEFFAR